MKNLQPSAWLLAAVMSSHVVDASAQTAQPQQITSSRGQVFSVFVDSTTNMLWFAFDSYKDGLAQGFRLATLDDLKAYNQPSTSFDKPFAGMLRQTSFSSVQNKTYEYSDAYAYVMDGTELAELNISTTRLYFCNYRYYSAAECNEPSTTRSGVYKAYSGSLDQPGTYSSSFSTSVIPVAMVREAAPVPEPASAGLALVGLMLAGGMARRRHASH